VVLCSHLHNDHNQVEVLENAKAARVFNGLKEGVKNRPAEWNLVDEKVGPVRVRSVGLYHDATDGMQRGKNAAWVVEADGLIYCHLGDLGHELTPAQAKAIGPVDVLMVPVGGVYTLNGEQAKKVVAQLKPKRLVVPMHYGVPGWDELLPTDEFLDETPNVRKLPDTNEVQVPTGEFTGPPVVAVPAWQKK
jgi:L-ascorbate metabolism protein UlaG (beta-lactamase superfamily)